MSDQLTLAAEMRERAGKGASRVLRRSGRVPAVIYGGKEQPQPIHIEEKALVKLLNTGYFMNSIVMVDIGGTRVRTLPKDVALDPVRDTPLHVDFLRLGKDATVDVSVPVIFANEEASPGLKRGGVLNVVRHELELVCDANRIPDQIEIDVTGLEVGDSIHISTVHLPDGSKSAITDRDFTIATIVAPSALKRDEGEQTGADLEPGGTAATEQGPDADAAQEQENKGS
ncbi:50S ribosomal protein L25/general stress protein Ctc [Croceicoccus sp. F390]|uniref:Large ribosomal subunit protein bL25 n=1 Tax=Croceicoccus esteveae TaxID=3075597 RepID=A0ABU2ZMG0_9SPHN|nr:50S ribosomal protein L25/general stress protein Ctc [Croceicoccus sp. F390]MDT0576617.1 50S ribosomal protein L25/general stress protein Ctc [Croceicoccus sp. F390]